MGDASRTCGSVTEQIRSKCSENSHLMASDLSRGRRGSLWQERFGPSIRVARIDSHVNDLCLGDLQNFAASIDEDGDVYRDRSSPDAYHPGQKADDISDQYGLVKFHAIHGHANQKWRLPALAHDLPAGADGACLIEIAQNDATEDGAVRIGNP